MKVKEKYFSVDARTIIQLGRDSIKEFTTALIELVKNSYDADAETVELEIFSKNKGNYIRIADDGFGMTEQIIDDNWLRIGFSEKRLKKRSQNNRRKTGEKGIGRIAADRLGKKLTIKTKSNEDKAQGLIVYWDKFDTDNKDIKDIPIEVIEDPILILPNKSKTGTEIIIEQLRQNWDVESLDKLYTELTTLTPPFTDNEKFGIYLKTDIDNKYNNKKIESTFDDAAEIELRVEYDGENDSLTYYIENRRFPGEEFIKKLKVNQIFTKEIEKKTNGFLCGPFSIRLLFFLRDSSVLERSNYSKLSEFRQILDQNVGIKIYRDGIAVKPYGYMDSQFGDWLGLAERKGQDPAGVGRESYKILPNQLVGGVFIGRDQNTGLLDSASREGLVENEDFEYLKIAVLSAIQILEAHRVDVYKKEKIDGKSKAGKFETKSSKVEEINKNIDQVKKILTESKLVISKENSIAFENTLVNFEKYINVVENKINSTFEEILRENRVLNGLATLGITSAVFGHETQSSISLLKQSANNAHENLEISPPDIDKIIRELEKVKKYSRQIGNWGNFALSRVSMEKRTLPANRKVHELIKDCINEIRPVIENSNIFIDIKIIDKVVTKVYPLDIEAILFNLITNAYQANLQVNSNRLIEVKLFREDRKLPGYCIQVSDNGPGIAKEFINMIWIPLFSTKIGVKKKTPTGTGLGLTIIESIVNELKGFAEAENSKSLNGAQFTIWLPKNN